MLEVTLFSGLNPFPLLKIVLMVVTEDQTRKNFTKSYQSLSSERRQTIVINGASEKKPKSFLLLQMAELTQGKEIFECK